MNSYKNRGIQIFGLGSALLVGLVAALSPACADTPTRECRVGADCASGICADDGQCVRPETPTTDGGTSSDADASSLVDGPASDAPAGDSALPGCVPNKDGTITRDEVPITAGLHATYKIGTSENVSTAGTTGAGGKRAWDFSAALNSDTSVIIETLPLKGKWYESKYPGATYASKLSVSSDLVGVFETSPGALLLLGVVSPTQGTSKGSQTNYDPKVPVLAFPLKMGATWTTDATVHGTGAGFDLSLYPTTEKYESKIDAAGVLKTPLGTFDVLRVGVVLTRKVTAFGVPTTTVVRSFAFVTECYGTVATVTSKDNEPNEEFTTAAEIRRISP